MILSKKPSCCGGTLRLSISRYVELLESKLFWFRILTHPSFLDIIPYFYPSLSDRPDSITALNVNLKPMRWNKRACESQWAPARSTPVEKNWTGRRFPEVSDLGITGEIGRSYVRKTTRSWLTSTRIKPWIREHRCRIYGFWFLTRRISFRLWVKISTTQLVTGQRKHPNLC